MMATESVFPPFLDTGDPIFNDPVLAQLMGEGSQDDLLTDLLGVRTAGSPSAGLV